MAVQMAKTSEAELASLQVLLPCSTLPPPPDASATCVLTVASSVWCPSTHSHWTRDEPHRIN